LAFAGCQQGSKTPVLSSAAASASNQAALVAPPKDYQKLGQALDTGLFLGAAAAEPLKAAGGGTYKLTTAGYQYYNAAGQATNWFGQKSASGNWALTQAKDEWTGGQPSFAGQATWTPQKTADGSWSGQWQSYENGAYKPLGFSTTYNTAATAATTRAAATANPWQTTWKGENGDVVTWNAAAPLGKPVNSEIVEGLTAEKQVMPQAQQFSVFNNQLQTIFPKAQEPSSQPGIQYASPYEEASPSTPSFEEPSGEPAYSESVMALH